MRKPNCCDKCFDEGVSQLSYGGCSNSQCECHCGADIPKPSPDWHEEERKAWDKASDDYNEKYLPMLGCCGGDYCFDPKGIEETHEDRIAKYWLDRMESRIAEAHDDARDRALASASTQIPYLRAEGYSAAIDEIEEKVKEEMPLAWFPESALHLKKRYLDSVLSLLSAMKK